MRSIKAVVVACALLFYGCGGGGGGGGGGSAPVPATNLAGTWGGTMEDTANVMHRVSVTINATGQITQISVDGAVVAGLTGAITVAGTNLYSFTFSDGTKGGFFADASATHVAFLDSDENVGVLQKGAGAAPVFAGGDVAGAWTGYNVELDANLNVTSTFNSNATIANNATRTFTGSDAVSGAFSGSLPTVDTVNGRWTGTFTQGAVAGQVHAFLSFDKTFAGTWNCPNTATNFIADCTFSAWHK